MSGLITKTLPTGYVHVTHPGCSGWWQGPEWPPPPGWESGRWVTPSLRKAIETALLDDPDGAP